MKKISLVSVLASVVLIGSSASAQVYGGSCVTIGADLSVGSRGSDVSALQTFLVSQNYPGGGSWMVTGYFGQATAQAVRNFQGQQGLASTGSLDASTRAAISRATCGAGSINYNYGTGYNYNNNYNYTNQYPTPTYPTYPQYTTNPVYPYSGNTYGTLALTSLSVNTGAPGSSVTVYGVGFEPLNNVVSFGAQTIGSVASNGTSLTFTIPAYVSNGTVDIRVLNSRGTSNALSFTVMSYFSYGCNYPYNYGSYNCGGTNLPYNDTMRPTLTSLTPTSGAVGSTVTVYGSGFTTNGNSVRFGQGVIANLNSFDGRGLSFTVPAQLSGFGSQVMTLDTYNVSVTNGSGYSTNALPFTVTSLASSASPTIVSVSGPTSLLPGVSGTWTVVVNNHGNTYLTTSVNWGDQGQGYAAVAPQTVIQQGTQTLTFSHAYAQTGTYTVAFTASNSSGSQTSSATVAVSPSATTQNLTLTSLSPTSGRVGTQVTLTGSGFTALNNTVHFGIGGMQNVASANGTTILYTIPSYLSACDLMTFGMACTPYAQSVVVGTYPVYVTNGNGASSILYFTVQL